METAIAKKPAENTAKDRLLQLVGFKIGKETFGVNILMVQEIIRKVNITNIPDCPEFIEGVINLRGNIIPVIDLRKRLRLYDPDKYDEGNWIIILNIQGRVTGFIVDSVTKVLKVPLTSFSHPPDLVVSGLKSHYIHGVCKVEKDLLIILNFDRILLIDEIKKLKEMRRH
ncbi:MAG: purine-binding chemotaxis protein CheW [Desulfobacteraceae bacterium]|nr:purine-binding chemotaxis protein CheW [Desulfobacteraceae bacterium]